ncbi:bacterioferritin [Cellvibrio sp. PSBB023]|jgi:bacterioferritin|uniref:ferritin-like domain-containing protein n=1 Tax=Cellvibrio sp. PSBB023 TaxID=1945512 RepID=UPI00122E5DA9|nr:ferritin-like domain-containing protein [Cellvibrio sp. PSBB023]
MKTIHSNNESEHLRDQAIINLEQGALTPGYSANVAEVIYYLNESLATELVCVLRYRANYFMARGIHAKGIAQEFLIHASEELLHVDMLASRIVQLGGEPDFSPDGLNNRSHVEYTAVISLVDMIRENLIAERIAIDSYRDFIHYLKEDDPTTSRMLKEILAMEEAHADELADWLEDFPTATVSELVIN